MYGLQSWDANHEEGRWLEEGDIDIGLEREHPWRQRRPLQPGKRPKEQRIIGENNSSGIW
jgi:hypothetical protein